MKQLETSEKEVKEGTKYELEALQKNESSLWKFPKKSKGEDLDKKLLKAASPKHSLWEVTQFASFLVCKGFA